MNAVVAASDRGPREALAIVTPEGISFRLPLAGPALRLLAWLVDVLVVLAFGKLLSETFAAFSPFMPDAAAALMTVFYFGFSIAYPILSEWLWRGQTIGKRLLHLRVVDAAGLRLRPSQVVVRNLLRAVDILPLAYLLGGVFCLATRHGQRLGDLAAGTVVTRRVAVPEPDWRQLGADKYNSLRDYPHLAARLRQKVTRAEIDLALQALLRREALRPEARIGLFAELAAHFQALVAFPPEAVEGLSPEAYVRNVVDLVLRPRVGG